MLNASQDSQPKIATLQWRMPVVPEDYADHNPLLTDEEKALMERYLALVPGIDKGIGTYSRDILARLPRFEGPLRDVAKLKASTYLRESICRRHLFRFMVQTGKAFWAWPEETWIEAIQSVPDASITYGTRLRLINLAYLFCNFIYVDDSSRFTVMAQSIFGKAVLEVEFEKLFTPLVELGYSNDLSTRKQFCWLCSLVMLVNRCPYVEAISAQVIKNVYDLIADLPGLTAYRGRRDLLRFQTALCALDILDEPVVLGRDQKQTTTRAELWRKDSTIDPQWLDWICAFYEQTPAYNERSLRGKCYNLLIAGRWLKKNHPEVKVPSQWTEELAREYTTFTCNALRGDQTNPSSRQYKAYQKAPQKLSAPAKSNRLAAMRVFFFSLQTRTYLVNGKYAPKLLLTWLPQEVFKTPNDIKAAIQPNPRDIQEDGWFKLIWAACTLKKEHMKATNRYRYPLAYYRAACLIWVTAARRSDEIRRLSVGCVRREWAPEMQDEDGHQIEPEEELCYLRVPTNKYKGEFYVPIPAYTADAIDVWEQLRPPNQRVILDRKTRKPTRYLFQYRNKLMGADFLNDHVIPLLCTLGGISRTDAVGKITSHRARATTATWMRNMGMSLSDIGHYLGHTHPEKSLPWYLRDNKHRLGRAYRKANPLDRVVAAILDTNAQAKGEPCVFYYLADGPDGRPRMCGNPQFNLCFHQLMCAECEAYIEPELAEVIEKREGALVIMVPIPLPQQMVKELNEQDEAGTEQNPGKKEVPPPLLPDPAFHFNKKVPMRVASSPPEDLNARLADLEAQIAKKGKADRRSASMRALLQERAEVQSLLAAQEKRSQLPDKEDKGASAQESEGSASAKEKGSN